MNGISIRLIGNKKGVYIDPANCNAYLDYTKAENYKDIKINVLCFCHYNYYLSVKFIFIIRQNIINIYWNICFDFRKFLDLCKLENFGGMYYNKVRKNIGRKEGMEITVSKAQQKATRKYEKENYDSILVKFPKGTKDRIKSSGSTVNGYIVKKVIESLEKEGL